MTNEGQRIDDIEREVHLSGSIGEGYCLIDTISLSVRVSQDGTIIVSSSDLGFYGVGNTVDEAIQDAGDMLCEMYEDLSDREEILSVYYRERLEALRALLALP